MIILCNKITKSGNNKDNNLWFNHYVMTELMVFYNLLIIRIIVMSHHLGSPRSATWRDGGFIRVTLTGQCQTRASSITAGGDKRRSPWGRLAACKSDRVSALHPPQRARTPGWQRLGNSEPCVVSVYAARAQSLRVCLQCLCAGSGTFVTLNLFWFRAILSFGVFVMFWHTHVRLFHTHRYINLEATLQKSAKRTTIPRVIREDSTLLLPALSLSVFFIAATQDDLVNFRPDSILLNKVSKNQISEGSKGLSCQIFLLVWGVLRAVLHSSICSEDD